MTKEKFISVPALMRQINEEHPYAGLPMAAYMCTMELLTSAPEVDIVDKIASFFEHEDNWHKLKSCWLEDGRSEDLRKLLKQALES